MQSLEAKDRPNTIVRPPRLYLGLLVLGLALDYWWPLALGLPAAFRFSTGPALIVLGFALLTIAMRQFKKAGTNVPTIKPTTAIVTDGLYRFSRNPIYIALSLIYGGIGVAVNAIWVLGLFIPILIIIYYGVILREERYLEEKFGEEYLRYKASVPRWL